VDGPGILYVLVGVAVLFGGWAIVKNALQQGRQARHTWRAFAAAKGLREEQRGSPATIRLKGLNRGYPFVLERVVRRRGNSHQTFTHVHLSLMGLPRGLRIQRRTSLRRLARLLGGGDIESGDDQFDQVFTVTGREPEDVRRFLTAERRQVLRESYEDLEDLRIDEGGLHWERRGVVRELEVLERVYARLGQLALTLCSPQR
jgi:hypothetical protein